MVKKKKKLKCFLFVSKISAYLLEAGKLVTFETYYCHKQTSLCNEERFAAEICMTDVERQTSGRTSVYVFIKRRKIIRVR